MKKSVLFILPVLLLCSCSKEIPVKNDDIIVGFMSGETQSPYHYETSPEDFYMDVIAQSSSDYYAYVSYYQNETFSIQCGFDSWNVDSYGKVDEEGENAYSLIDLHITYPVFGKNLKQKYTFNALVWNIKRKEIRWEPITTPDGFEEGCETGVFVTYDNVYSSMDDDNPVEYYKFSRGNIVFTPEYNKVNSYAIKEYDASDKLLKTEQNDFEEMMYYTSVDCESVIIEKQCTEFVYDYDEGKFVTKEITIKEAYNRSDFSSACTSFYVDENGDAEKQTLFIYFDMLDYNE